MGNENNGSNQSISKIENLQSLIQADFVQKQLNAALGDNASVFSASLVELFSGDQYLKQCDPKLLIVEAIKAATLKLPINKALGFAWLIAYKSNNVMTPQFQIGYKGLIQLAIRTSMYRTINAGVVYEGELRSIDKLTGTFDLSGVAKSDNVIGYFSYFELTNGFSKTLYMTKPQVEAHAKKYSKSYSFKGSPWQTEFDAMGIKTAVRGLLTHWGYLSVELARAIEQDLDDDAADRVADEIRSRGNDKAIGFSDAVVVEGKGEAKQPTETNNVNAQENGGPASW